MGFVIRAKREDEKPFEFMIRNTPVIQRFLRITDYGAIESERAEKKEYRQFQAIRRIERRR